MLGLGDAIFGLWQKWQSVARPMFAQADRIMSRLLHYFEAVLELWRQTDFDRQRQAADTSETAS
jgi:hypothetical protein